MPEGDFARELQAPAPKGAWFSDLRFHWDASITVKSSGVRITLKDLTAGELAKFFGYLGVVLLQGARARLRPGSKPRVWFSPARPRPWYVVWSAVTLSGARIVRSEADADAVFYFEDVTVGRPPILARGEAINGRCFDITKSRVAQCFEAAAGYPLALDPRTHQGEAVEKSEANGKHDGRLVQCPTAPKPGMAYQLFIDGSDGAGTAYDLRTTIIDRKPACVLVKTKPADARFSIHNATVTFQPLSQVFSAGEIALLARFAEAMALDWGALDVLRDRATGRIYVVDANKTDTGPAVDLSWRDREKLKAVLAQGFAELVKRRALDRPVRFRE